MMSSIQCPACLTDNLPGTVACTACGYSPLTPPVTADSFMPSVYNLPIGTTLKNRYRIEQMLGEGGFGITYKAIDTLQNSMTVAIKELWPERAARVGTRVAWPSSIAPKERQQQLKKFRLEADYLRRCVHPHITQVYDWFEENDTAYLIMEFIAGKSLYQLLKEGGTLAEHQAKRYFLQIAEALKVIHAYHFLHRDIKPDNILIDHSDRAVLIDFGATREFMAGQTREMSVTLTKGYAPLEQYSYLSKRYPATDIYALCASMYELVTGELPAEATQRASPSDTISLIPPRQLRSSLSAQLEQVIMTGLNMRVEERFQTADELIDALNGKFVSPSQRRAHELIKQGQLTEAVQAYEACLTSEPNNGEAAVELALVQMYRDDVAAEACARHAIQFKPNDGRSYGVLGLVACRCADWAEAKRHLQQAVSLTPNEAWIQSNLAWALGQLGQWQEAHSAVQRALSLEANCPFTLGVKAWITTNLQSWKETIRAAKPATFHLKQNRSRRSEELQSWVYPLLILALDQAVSTQQSNDVERCIAEFIQYVPNSAMAWGLKGWRSAAQGQWAEAQDCYQRAIQQTQVPAWIFKNLGAIYEKTNNLPLAIQVYEAYSQTFPTDAYSYFRQGTLLAKRQEWQGAIAALEQTIGLRSDYAEAYHNLAWSLLNLKDDEGQIEEVRKMMVAYRRAIELYEQQRQGTVVQGIRKAFQTAGVDLG
jgi:eukaryotic-like serine/threonine-protein kinase